MAPITAERVNISGSTLTDVGGHQYNYYAPENKSNIFLETLRLASVNDARYNSRNHVPPCHPNTRSDILANIFGWISEPGSSSICWLSGKGGSGKSAVAQSVSEECFAKANRAGGTFFFNQEQNRCTTDHFVATIAYQFAISNPSLENPICSAVRQDKDVLDADFNYQLQKLIINPLQSLPDSKDPMVLVVDALDECDSHDLMAEHLATLVVATTKLGFPLRIFITSRREPRFLRASFEHSTIHSRYNLQDFQADTDIRTFLESRFRDIRQARSAVMHGVELSWPSSKDMDALIKKSSGLFIYASTVARLIGDKHALPHEQLKEVLNAKYRSGFWDHADLDDLYMKVMSTSPDILKEQLKTVIGAIIFLQCPLTAEELAHLLEIDVSHLLLALERCHPILSIPDEPNEGPVTMLHLSLRDFLTSEERAQRFYIDPSSKHADLAKCCLVQIKTLPHSTLTNLSNPRKCWDAVIKNLTTRDSTYRATARYSCRFWSFHLSASLPIRQDLMIHVKEFFNQYALSWRIFLEMEALQCQQDCVMTPEEEQERALDRETEMGLAKEREQRLSREKWMWILALVMAGGLMATLWIMKVLSALRSKGEVGVIAVLQAVWNEVIWGPEDPGLANSMWNALLLGPLLAMCLKLHLELALALALGMWLVLELALGLGLMIGLGMWMARALALATGSGIVAVLLGWNWIRQDRPVKVWMLLMYEALMITQGRNGMRIDQRDIKRCVLRANGLMMKMPFRWRFTFYSVLTASVTDQLELVMKGAARSETEDS